MAKSYAPGLPPEQRAAMNNGTFAIRVTGVLASGPCNRFSFDLAKCGRFAAAEVLPSSVDMTLVCKVTCGRTRIV